MIAPEAEVILAWHRALNAGDVETLLNLSTDDVEVGGPRGSGSGAGLLRDWVARAQIEMEPLRWFAGSEPGLLVVEQSARWPSVDGANVEPQIVASVFRVRDGRVAAVLRYPDLATASSAAGISVA
jgi:ketosteroid isomerase-like protein